jgi:regulator of replication initiation timing
METPSVVFYEHSFDDTLIQSLSKNVLNLGNECRALSDENKRLKHEAVHSIGQLGEQSAEIADLKSKIERLLHEVNYWRIEAETDHGRWLRCLEQLEEIRNLK